MAKKKRADDVVEAIPVTENPNENPFLGEMREDLKRMQEKVEKMDKAQDIVFTPRMAFEDKVRALRDLGYNDKQTLYILKPKRDTDINGDETVRPGFKSQYRRVAKGQLATLKNMVQMLEAEAGVQHTSAEERRDEARQQGGDQQHSPG